VSDAPRVAKPSVLRASKKLCVRGRVLSLMSAAGGGATNAFVGAGAVSAAVGGVSAGANFISVAFISVSAGAMSVPETGAVSGSVTATMAFAVGAADAVAEDVFADAAFAEAAFAVEVEAEESDAEAGVEAGEGTPCRSAAKADDPNSAKNIAATATLISLPRRERERARTIEYRLNVDFYWQFLPRKPLVKIGPATELRELRALPG
jgi:hypothetical protein